jgi:hypothetical protein
MHPELPFERPVFPKLKVSTKLNVPDGGHAVFGGFQDLSERKKIWYFVIKASVIKPLEHPEW